MALTNFAALTTEQKTVWAMDTWRAARNMAFVNKFLGKGPNSMIQHITELKKTEKGARAVITLLADLEGDGVAGDRTLEGNEEAMKSYDQVIQIDQLRHANRHEGKMADQRSVVEFRENSRDVLGYWLSDRIDQMAFLTMAGISYAYKPNGAARVGSDLINLEFAADVSAPTAKRRLRWDATAGAIVTSAATSGVLPGDKPSYAMLVALKAYAKEHYVRGIKGEGGSENYVVFMTPTGVAALKRDPDYLANVRNAAPRSRRQPAVQRRGGERRRPRDPRIPSRAEHLGAASGSKFGGAGTIDGQHMLLCGAQALGMADLGSPEWVEKGFDYENQQGISVGKILGFKKPAFRSIYDQSTEDFGVIVCYTAVSE
jgi:N4-gp56 family major capsid protein